MIPEGLYGEIKQPPEKSIAAAIRDITSIRDYMDRRAEYRYDQKQFALDLVIDILEQIKAAQNRQELQPPVG
ncbi:hypothetical protein [Phascolarctobacterium faecium]|mgnify:FL=1|jgi:hypothetical protein|uniref:hypothetical protein n=1 Tax=Phascolarctobacterium faecium TaxID=33025 RepID=UPI002FE091DD